ncbi:TonB-dependent hemoglobin/transferrin/lactoferrin family receptor [Neisseriaceae bacterium ESL0693]|nr:TonB-dependent hemoglobin/transferrin/lactoferrin family receptor [Neisseriaceae bacterium ESL0693]
MPYSPKTLVLALALIGFSGAVWAEDEGRLPTVEVKAHNEKTGIFQPVKVNATEITRKDAVDLKTALTDIPGVDVLGAQSTRQGNDSITIRGLSGNRVAMSIDGIDMPESNENKETGQYVIFGRGNFVDVSALSHIDVSKNAQGFGLGGSVAMHTLTPNEILRGQPQGGYIDTQYNSEDKSSAVTGAGALQRGAWRGMVLGTYRKGSETDNRGDVGGQGEYRTKSDPSDHNSRYFLTKHEFDLDDRNTLNFAAEYLSRNQWTDSLSQANKQYHDIHGFDENQKIRFSVGHQYHNDGGLIQQGDTQLYWQKTKTSSATQRLYTKGCQQGGPSVNNRCLFDFNNQDEVWGLNTDWASSFDSDVVQQLWHYGAKVAYHDLTSDWAGYYAKSKPTANSKSLRGSVFVDGDVSIGRWLISPGLSMNYYRINPNNQGYEPGTDHQIAQLKKQSDFALTPRLGIAYRLTPLLEPYFQYSRGFNAPSSQQLAFSWNTGNYSIWGNPNLKAETANNFELGLRGQNDVFAYGISGFDNHYKNFIDYADVSNSVTLPGTWTPNQLFILQSQNFSKAHIYGGEAYARWKFAPDWKVSGSLAYARGSLRQDGVDHPLNSVSPMKVKLGLAYEQERWGSHVDLTYVAAKKDKDIYSASSFYNPSRSYALVDMGGYWKPAKHLSLRLGVNNVFNQKYWNWSDIAYLTPNVHDNAHGTTGASDGNTVSMTRNNADFYSAPGRTFNLGLRYTF